MADYIIEAGGSEIGSPAFTLAAGVVSTVTFNQVDEPQVEIISDGAAAVWYTFDPDATPAVDSAACYYLPPQPCVDLRQPFTSGSTVVKLISAGTPTIRVQRGY